MALVSVWQSSAVWRYLAVWLARVGGFGNPPRQDDGGARGAMADGQGYFWDGLDAVKDKNAPYSGKRASSLAGLGGRSRASGIHRDGVKLQRGSAKGTSRS